MGLNFGTLFAVERDDLWNIFGLNVELVIENLVSFGGFTAFFSIIVSSSLFFLTFAVWILAILPPFKVYNPLIEVLNSQQKFYSP